MKKTLLAAAAVVALGAAGITAGHAQNRTPDGSAGLTESQARAVAMNSLGNNISNLSMDRNGAWHGTAQASNVAVPFTVEPTGKLTKGK